MWSSADTNAEQASRSNPIDTRSPEQCRFEKASDDVRGIVNRMCKYTSDPRWSQNATTVRMISDMETELARKLSAVRLDGPVVSS